jgi:hypothetical protein
MPSGSSQAGDAGLGIADTASPPQKRDRRQEDAVGLSGDFEVFVPDEAEKSEIKDTRPPSA